MATTTKDKPIISPLPAHISATVASMTIKSFAEPESAELFMEEPLAYKSRETEYTFVSYVEPFAILRKHLQSIKGIKRACLTHEEYVIHVWIVIEKKTGKSERASTTLSTTFTFQNLLLSDLISTSRRNAIFPAAFRYSADRTE
jgi:hypothetical protein